MIDQGKSWGGGKRTWGQGHEEERGKKWQDDVTVKDLESEIER